MTELPVGPERPLPGKKVSVRNVLVLTAAVICCSGLLLGAAMWAAGAYRGFIAARAVRARHAPLLEEARSLGLTYEYAKAYPDKAPGKHALWCLRPQPGQAEAWYDADPKKPLFLINREAMYSMAGSSHQNCVRTLVKIASVKPYEFSPGKLRIEAEFIGYP